MTLRFLTAGESHGPQLTAILEGMPAGLEIDRAALNMALARRQRGHGSSARMRIERDEAIISAGVLAGRTTGAPIALTIKNRDYVSWSERDIAPMTTPRPGHADLSATVKYGYADLRLALERASARETAARVAVGALCSQLLAVFEIGVGSYVVSIGGAEADLDQHGREQPPGQTLSPGPTPSPGQTPPSGDTQPPGEMRSPRELPDLAAMYRERFERAEESDVRCPDRAAAERMREAIDEARLAKDTVGGVFEIVAVGVPPGLGSHVHADRRLTGKLMAAVGSIPAVKGVELGQAFRLASRRGTDVHDRIAVTDGMLVRDGNNAAGVEGGISTGAPIVVRGAMKPISTTLQPLQSVDLATGRPEATTYERSDICAVPRAAVVGEAAVAIVLADALLEKLGGDSLTEMRPRFDSLRRGLLSELEPDNRPWRFDYESEA